MSSSVERDLGTKPFPLHPKLLLYGHRAAVQKIKFVPSLSPSTISGEGSEGGGYCLSCSADKTIKLWNPFRKVTKEEALFNIQNTFFVDTPSSPTSVRKNSTSFDSSNYSSHYTTGYSHHILNDNMESRIQKRSMSLRQKFYIDQEEKKFRFEKEQKEKGRNMISPPSNDLWKLPYTNASGDFNGTPDIIERSEEYEFGYLIQSFEGASGHTRQVMDISISSDNRHFLSVGGDRHLLLWDVTTNQVIRKMYNIHLSVINSCDLIKSNFSTSDRKKQNENQGQDSIALTGSQDGTAKIFDLRANNSTPVETLKADKSVTKVFLSPSKLSGNLQNGNNIISKIKNEHSPYIITTSLDGKLRTYDPRKFSLTIDDYSSFPLPFCTSNNTTTNPRSFQAERRRLAISSASISNDSNCLLLSTLNDGLLLVEKATGSILATYSDPNFTSRTYSLEAIFDNKDSCIYAGSENGQLFRWNLVSNSTEISIVNQEVGGDDSTIQIRTNSTCTAVSPWTPHETENGKTVPICSLAYHPSLKQLLTAGHDGNIFLWSKERTSNPL